MRRLERAAHGFSPQTKLFFICGSPTFLFFFLIFILLFLKQSCVIAWDRVSPPLNLERRRQLQSLRSPAGASGLVRF